MDILKMGLDELLKINPNEYLIKDLAQEECLHIFDMCAAFWEHSGDPKDPHVELTGGKCSNIYFNAGQVLTYLQFSKMFSLVLARRIRKLIGDIPIDWVIGSPMAGITFAYALADALGARRAGFTEKDPKKQGRMTWKRWTIGSGANVLQAEELMTTAGTAKAVRRAVERDNPEPVNFIDVVASVVVRPEQLPIVLPDQRRVVSLIEKEAWNAEQSACSLCAQGSPRHKFKANQKLFLKN